MERKCKNKKCQKYLPEGYKYKHCESCRNEHVENLKGKGKIALGIVIASGTLLSFLVKEKSEE